MTILHYLVLNLCEYFTLHEYLERRQFLQTPENQTKLLEKIPTVIPDIEEAEPLEDDKKDNKDSPKSILIHSSSGKFKDIGITSGMINIFFSGNLHFWSLHYSCFFNFAPYLKMTTFGL